MLRLLSVSCCNQKYSCLSRRALLLILLRDHSQTIAEADSYVTAEERAAVNSKFTVFKEVCRQFKPVFRYGNSKSLNELLI